MKKLVIATLLITMISGATAQSTGAAPSFQNLGEVQPGQTVRSTIYVTGTSYDQPYAVGPEAVAPLASKMLNPQEAPFPVEQYSEETISEWVIFDQETYIVDPNNSTPYVLANGAQINANGEVTFNIRVPEDAEPGWHSGSVALNPQTSSGGTGFGSSAQTVSRPTFVFDVETGQEPSRRIEVVDARGIRTGDSSARIDMRVVNRGTVTTSIRGGDMDVYNRATNTKVGDLSLGYQSLSPSQSEVISLDFDSGNVSAGSYVINGTLDYSSSEAFVGGQTFALTSQIQTSPEDPEEFNESTGGEEESSTPLWLLGLFVLVLATVMYSFGFDLFWIIVGAGFIGIGVFILVSPASNWLLLILLTTPVIIMYYV